MAEVLEGTTRLEVPGTNLRQGAAAPGAREKGQPFYNPGMALNRDLSVLLVEAFAQQKGRQIDVADALCGTGARAVRWAREVQRDIIVHANDADPLAVEASAQNALRNGVDRARLVLSEGDAHAFLAARKYDLVDLDPCGSPMPFLDAAVRATRHAGLVCVTATDTGALAGAFPRACRRRYDAHHGLHAHPWRSEVGLRILAGAVVRSAARFDRQATPVLGASKGHWMRVVARVEDGKKGADAAVKRLRAATVDPDGLPRWEPGPVPSNSLPAGRQGTWAGPLWSGPLHDAALVQGMLEAASVVWGARGPVPGDPPRPEAPGDLHAASSAQALAQAGPSQAAHPPTSATGETATLPAQCGPTVALLGLLQGECEAPAFWLHPDSFQKALGPPPRRDELVERLREAGFKAARTHLDPQGVRTDAGFDALRQAWRG